MLGFGQQPDRIRKAELLQGRDGEWDHSHHDHERGTLPEEIDPEPAHAGKAPGTVIVGELVEAGAIGVGRHQLDRHGPGLVGRKALLGERHQLAIDPGPEQIPRLDVEIRGATVNGRLDDPLDRDAGH